MTHPVDNVRWVEAATLSANHWNPNLVMNAELKLLERSLLRQGWIQPLLISRDGVVIDGFHRWQLALRSAPVRRAYGTRVPTVTLDMDEASAICLSVRINRAKGSHQAIKMADLVKALLDVHGYAPEQVADEMGMTADEVRLLAAPDIFARRQTANHAYSKAWIPETVTQAKERQKSPKTRQKSGG